MAVLKIKNKKGQWVAKPFFQPKADQTYNPSSENAQSGTAIAEAKQQTEAYVNKTFAPAIRNTVSGDIVKASDVSPIEHELGVQLSCGNKIEDFIDWDKISSYEFTGNPIANKWIFTKDGDGAFSLDYIPETAGNYPSFYTFNFKDANGTYLKLSDMCPNLKVGDTVTFHFETETSCYLNFGGRGVGNNAYSTITITQDMLSTQISLTTYAQPPTTISNFFIGHVTDEPLIEDFKKVTVTRCGKNLIPQYIDGVTDEYTTQVNSYQMYNLPIRLSKGNVLTLSADLNGSSVLYFVPQLNNEPIPNADGNYKSLPYATGRQSLSFTLTSDIDSVNIYVMRIGEALPVYTYLTVGTIPQNMQLVIGTDTSYEPYSVYNTHPNNEGTVSGLTSTSPNMTVFTDNADAVIDLTYNADTKMYIDNKFNELATALLNT